MRKVNTRICTICENAPQMLGSARCVKCQDLFNTIRKPNPQAITKEKRVAPTVAQLRAALGMPPKVSKRLKSAGHTAKRQKNGVGDPEYAAAKGYIRDYRAQQEGKQGYVYCIVEESGLMNSTPATAAADPKHPSGFVYGPFCKIGYSTNPEARVAELQTGNPRKLTLLGKLPGTEADEAEMHQRYIFHNVLQEWFVLTPMIRYEFTKVPSDSVARVAS
jgi:hypothetical protein